MNGTAPGQSLSLPPAAVERTRLNLPGQSQLTYRGGAFLPTLDRMLMRLARQAVPGPDGVSAGVPFAGFNLDSSDDWSLALLHAWAAVTDVLGFYQERIVNEGYLRTATERLSVVQLARTVGYELQPGLAASAMLALTVVQGHGEPPQSVFVPKGTAAQSVPSPKSGLHQGTPSTTLPQIFETSADFVARSEWNLLRPAALGELTWEHRLLPGVNSLRLLGQRTDLKKGDRLLFVGQDPDDAQRTLWRMAQVTSTTPNVPKGFTVITWENAPGMPAAPLPYLGPYHRADLDAAAGADQPVLGKAIAAPQVFVLRQKAKLFPYTATGVYRNWQALEMAAATEAGGSYCLWPQWWPAGIGLPHEPVELLVATRRGHLLAVTKKDIYRSLDAGATWRLAGSGLAGKHVTALTSGEDGALYAGTDKGEVHLSQDEGETWRQAAGTPVRLPVRGLGKLVPAFLRSSGHLPEVVVSSLASYRNGSKEVLAAGSDSGVFLSPDRGGTWKPANLVLPKLDRKTGMAKVSVRALAAVQAGRHRILYAGTDAGVFPIRPTPSASPVLGAGLVLALLYRLFFDPGGVLAKKVYHAVVKFIQQLGTTLVLPKPLAAILDIVNQYPILWLFVDAALIAIAIAAVTAAWWLIWRFLNQRPARRIAGTPPPAPPPTAIPGKLPSEKDLAQELAPKDPPVPVGDLRSSAAGLFAGTAQGIYHTAAPGPRSQDSGLRRLFSRLLQLVFPGLLSGWTHLESTSTPKPDIQTLAMPDAEVLVAATQAGAIYRYRNVDNSWQPGREDRSPLALRGIAAAVATSDGLFLSGTPPQAKVAQQWSPWQLQDRAIHFDAAYDGILAKSWLVLESAGAGQGGTSGPLPRLYQVVHAERSDSQDAAKGVQYSRIIVDRGEGLAFYDRTATQALFQSEPLELYDDEPVCGTTLQLNSFVPGLKQGQYVIVSGKRMRARLVASEGTTVMLTSVDGLQAVAVQPGESLVLLKPPLRKPASSPSQAPTPSPDDASRDRQAETWYVLNRDGIAGQVEVQTGPGGEARFVMESPRQEDPEVSELAAIQGIGGDSRRTTLRLTTNLTALDAEPQPLANVFERPTVTVRANIVQATHGATVPAEVLGSSDGSQGNQRFVLRQAPLTYVSSDTPEGLQSTLAITVAGVRWHQVPFLYGHPRDERAYAVQHDEQDRAAVTFGDGQAGARLPSTREEVRATYRVGIGQPGNVPAGSLTQLRAAPHGLTKVTNPLPAAGGIDPEADDSIRMNAPLRLRAMHRIVSLSDYEDFVRAFAGIGRVQAKMVHRGHGGLLHMTVADADGNPLDTRSTLYANLVSAVERARVAPIPKLQIDSYEAIYFDVAATLMVSHDYQARQLLIKQRARQALRDAFAFQRREFAQDVSAAEIVSLLQPIEGVVGVAINRLARHQAGVISPATPAPPPAPPGTLLAHEPKPLVARPARLQDGVVVPAQMLLINTLSPEGITVDVEFV